MFKSGLVALLIIALIAPLLGKQRIIGTKCRQQLPKACVFPKMCCCPQSQSLYLRQDRWWYNNNTGKCEEFVGGDEDCNNFESVDECNRHCGPDIPKSC
nr:eppin-like [Dermacentor andersoni]